MVRPLLVASLGNPGPYARTLHSAGHLLLDTVRQEAGLSPFTRHTAAGPIYTLYQSPSYMNVSGATVQKAYKAFLKDLPPEQRRDARLVVLHDELEQPLGKVRMKTGGSHKGHNGLKSVAGAMTGQDWVKIGVGIGRPESRDPADVERYVLRQVTPGEEAKIRGAATGVMELLENLAEEG